MGEVSVERIAAPRHSPVGDTSMRTFVTFLSQRHACVAGRPCRSDRSCSISTASASSSAPAVSAPGESARLDFNAAEMNDVLKSLTVEEKGGGKISGLRYDSMDPLGHKLAEFPFKIGDEQPLSAHARPAQRRARRAEVRHRNRRRRDRRRPPDPRQRQTAGARAAHPAARYRRTAHRRSQRRHRHPLHRPASSSSSSRITWRPGRRALEGQAQRLHRLHRCQGSATSPPAT